MLKLVKISKQDYEILPEDKQQLKETMFLVTDTITSRCSIYIDGVCYGEDIDETAINDRIADVEEQMSNYNLADNRDILDIINNNL